MQQKPPATAAGVATSLSSGTHLTYRNGLQGLLHIYRTEGALQLYRGAVPMTIRGSCFRGGAFFGYDTTKTYCKKFGLLEDGPVNSELNVHTRKAHTYIYCGE